MMMTITGLNIFFWLVSISIWELLEHCWLPNVAQPTVSKHLTLPSGRVPRHTSAEASIWAQCATMCRSTKRTLNIRDCSRSIQYRNGQFLTHPYLTTKHRPPTPCYVTNWVISHLPLEHLKRSCRLKHQHCVVYPKILSKICVKKWHRLVCRQTTILARELGDNDTHHLPYLSPLGG